VPSYAASESVSRPRPFTAAVGTKAINRAAIWTARPTCAQDKINLV